MSASAYMGDGSPTTQPHWDFGLNGQDIILGVADSGIDDDHSCFRNDTDSVGQIGDGHRKIIITIPASMMVIIPVNLITVTELSQGRLACMS